MALFTHLCDKIISATIHTMAYKSEGGSERDSQWKRHILGHRTCAIKNFHQIYTLILAKAVFVHSVEQLLQISLFFSILALSHSEFFFGSYVLTNCWNFVDCNRSNCPSDLLSTITLNPISTALFCDMIQWEIPKIGFQAIHSSMEMESSLQQNKSWRWRWDLRDDLLVQLPSCIWNEDARIATFWFPDWELNRITSLWID